MTTGSILAIKTESITITTNLDKLKMTDTIMCTNFDCAMQGGCWRLNQPPVLNQKYKKFEFDDEAFEKDSNYQCEFYIETPMI